MITVSDLSAMNEAITRYGLIAIEAKIDTQVILQLLTQKGIVTREEVETMRNIVMDKTEYGELYKLTVKIADQLNDANEIKKLMNRMYTKGADSLTQEELDKVSKALNEVINGEKTDEKE